MNTQERTSERCIRKILFPAALIACHFAQDALRAQALPGPFDPTSFQRLLFDSQEFGGCFDIGSIFRAEIERDASGELHVNFLRRRSRERLPEAECDLRENPSCYDFERMVRRLSALETEFVETSLASVLANLEMGQLDICPLWDPCRIDRLTVDGVLVPGDPCHEGPILFGESYLEFIAMLDALWQDEVFLEGDNGDVNGDEAIGLSDAVYLLGWLFRSGPAPIDYECGLDFDCGSEPVVLENGDVNGDRARDISDAVYLLVHLFAGGDEPLPICSCP